LPDSAPQIGVEGAADSAENSIGIRNLLNSAGPAPPTRPATPPPDSTPKAAPAAPKAIRVSGPVEAALLIHRVDPVYPKLAQQIRVSGTVELNGIVGADGHIRELHAASGHPLLVPAALDAVRQWVYRPTLLHGQPVEVITTITVIFRLQ
jgi:protein TonB